MSEHPLRARPGPDVADQQHPVRDIERDDEEGVIDAPLEADTVDVAGQHPSVPPPPDEEL